jgi:hypothetical protein
MYINNNEEFFLIALDTVRYLPSIPDYSRVHTLFQNLTAEYLMLKIAMRYERNVEIIILHRPNIRLVIGTISAT